MSKNTKKKAFTLVELMLAVAFLGTLLLSIAMLTMQLMNIYTKGSTMRAINASGSAIMRDIRSSVLSSSSHPEVLDVARDNRESFLWRDKDIDAQSRSGMFCTGSYTYVWNYQAAMVDFRKSASGDSYLEIEIDGASEAYPYAFAKIRDEGCLRFERTKKEGGKKVKITRNEDLTILVDGRTGSDGSDLALYDFSIISATRSVETGKAIYDISFVLGTMQGNIDVTSASNYCKQRTAGVEADEYSGAKLSLCSVNRFEFVARQGVAEIK